MNSLNKKVDNYSKASFGMKNGKIYIGDMGIEFYDNNNRKNYVQIPWNEIYQIRAQVLFSGKYIRGFYVDTKQSGKFNFLVSDAKIILKSIRPYLKEEQLLKARTLTSSLTRILSKRN